MADESRQSPATALFARQYEARAGVREQWRKDAGDLLDAHQFATSMLASMIDRVAGVEFDKQAQEIEGQLSLAAQFIMGIDLCEVSLSEGLYSQAAALLKQEMEIIEAIAEYDQGKRADGATPRLSLFKGFGRTYGEFNRYAHASVEELHKYLVSFEEGDVAGPSILPQYRKELVEGFYGLHTYFIVECGRQMIRLMKTVYDLEPTPEETVMNLSAIRILVRREIIAHEGDGYEKLMQLFERIDAAKQRFD